MTSQPLFDYTAYEEAFNAGDDDGLVDTYFADDVTFEGSSMSLHGREEVRAFLHRAHDGILESMRPQNVMVSPGRVAAEIDMDFQATRDRQDFQFGPLLAGEVLTVKFFCVYEIEDGRISALRAATWAAGRGVSEPPTFITPDGKGKHALRRYAAAFSKGDADRFTAYYTDDVVLVLPSMTLHGKDAIRGFYEKMFVQVSERLTFTSIIADRGGLAVDVTSRFTAHEDAPDLAIGPLRAGESYEGRYFIHYQLRDGRIARIEAARREPLRGPFRAGEE